jgi:hypothetical protein
VERSVEDLENECDTESVRAEEKKEKIVEGEDDDIHRLL